MLPHDICLGRLLQVAHLLDSATSEWSAITGDLAAALPEPQPAAEAAQAENVPPATEPLRERRGGGLGPAGGCGVQGASGMSAACCGKCVKAVT